MNNDIDPLTGMTNAQILGTKTKQVIKPKGQESEKVNPETQREGNRAGAARVVNPLEVKTNLPRGGAGTIEGLEEEIIANDPEIQRFIKYRDAERKAKRGA